MLPQEKAIQLKKDYLRVFNSEDGKRVLKDLEFRCFRWMTTETGNPSETSSNEGMRKVLLHIETMMSQEDIEKGESAT